MPLKGRRPERLPYDLEQPIYDAATDRFGKVDNDLPGNPPAPRLGFAIHLPDTSRVRSPGSESKTAPPSLASPPCNGCAERLMGPARSSACGRVSITTSDLRRAVIEFTWRYNNEWLIERHGHSTPRDAYAVHKLKGRTSWELWRMLRISSRGRVWMMPQYA